MNAKPVLRTAGAIVVAATFGIAALWGAPHGAAQAANPLAQVAPTESPTPVNGESPAPTSSESPAPMETMVPAPMESPEPGSTTAPGGTAPAAGTDLLNNNPNGPNWLSKFARKPGPDRTQRNMSPGTMKPRMVKTKRRSVHNMTKPMPMSSSMPEPSPAPTMQP